MCGIAGYHGTPPGRLPNRELLERMIGVVKHRGPDGKGTAVFPGAGLAHVRLSIIDLAGGRQPMSNAEGTIHLTFNGEIFNYVELREELISRGHRFRTSSDTEVILHLYEERGIRCLEALNGDFAFAIWDSRQQRLMVARDRMGVRPLFYTKRDDTFYFASEVKSLLEVPGTDPELDTVALDQIFTFWFPLPPRTAFKDIHELSPGHFLTVEKGRMEVRSYWQLDYPDAAESEVLCNRSEGDITEELRALLLDATRIRLRSDIPVGAYLSGGLDSSIVTALVKRIRSDQLRTFSVTFESEEFDESSFQQDMVRALRTEHSSIYCTSSDIGHHFPNVIRHGERPILRTAPAPLMRLADLTHSKGYKVVLTGEGADEVFAGYDIFKEAKVRRFCARQPQSSWRALLFKRLYPYLPQLRSQSHHYLDAFFTTGAATLDDPLFSHLPRFKTTSGAKLFFSDDLRAINKNYDALDDLRQRLPANFSRWHPLSQAQFLETAYLLPGYILSSQGDRMAMAHAVEGRFPFLDHRVVEFASRIPARLKIRGLREKHILRLAFKNILPQNIGNRTKQPYRAPDCHSFVGTQAPAYVAQLLSNYELATTGLFDVRAVRKLADKCGRQKTIGFRDNMAFVGVLSTQLWYREFVRHADNASDRHSTVA